jgi:hypothetical protein
VTASRGLRNDADHGHYEEFQGSQIALMIQRVRDFLIRYPA